MKMKTKLNKREHDLMKTLLKHGRIAPNYYTGQGRFSKKSANHALYLVQALQSHGFKRMVHFKTGNDSPRGGHSGEFVELTKRGTTRMNKLFNF